MLHFVLCLVGLCFTRIWLSILFLFVCTWLVTLPPCLSCWFVLVVTGGNKNLKMRAVDLRNASFVAILNNLNVEQKAFVRNIEKLNNKVIAEKYGVLFNQTCIAEELLPSYTHIYIYDFILKISSPPLLQNRLLDFYKLVWHFL